MNKNVKLPSGNLTLVLLSVIIASSFIILIYTQAEGIKGHNIEFDSIYGQQIEIPIFSDFTNDNISDLVIMIKPFNDTRKIYNINYGMIKLYNILDKKVVWTLNLNAPPINIYKIFDYNGDGINDLFLTYGTPNKTSVWNYDLNYLANKYGNSFISGANGSILKIGGTKENLTNKYISNFIIYDINFNNNIEDFVVVQTDSPYSYNNFNITAYFLNGTICKNYQFKNQPISDLKIINYLSKKQLLAISSNKAFILNTSSPNNYSIISEIDETSNYDICYIVLNDLNNDNCSELLVLNQSTLKLISGLDGTIIDYINLSFSQNTYFKIIQIDDINGDDKNEFLLYKYDTYSSNIKEINMFTINYNNNSINLLYNITTEPNTIQCILINNIYFDDNKPKFFSFIKSCSENFDYNSYSLTDINLKINYWTYKTNTYSSTIKNISNIFNDNSLYIILIDNYNIDIISIKGPENYWLLFLKYPEFISYFIAVLISIILIIISFTIIMINRHQFKKNIKELIKYRENVQRLKVPIIISIILIIIFIINFAILNFLTGIFRITLILGSYNEFVLIGTILLYTIFFSSLPLLPAFYNKTAPTASIAILKLRKIFFKFIRHSEKKIIIINIDENKHLSNATILKRCLFPILISLSIGINIFNYIAPKFSSVSIEIEKIFYTFQYYFIYYAIVPMLISFYLLFIFIPSTWLLDDAGVVYMIKPKKSHLPPDIESLSNWAHNWLEGLAGFTAIISYINLLSVINLYEFGFGEPFSQLITILTVILFYGFPFLSGFILMLLSIIYMEFNLEYNKIKLYKKMEKRNYDITKKEIKLIDHQNND